VPKVPPEVVRQREVDAWALRCAGTEQAAIAEQLGVTQQAVSLILKRVSARAMKQLDADVLSARAVHTARLERIFAEAMHAWDESKKPRQKSRSRKTIVPAAGPDLAEMHVGQQIIGGLPTAAVLREETVKEASKSDGDVGYLQAALHADAEQRKLHGINAPKKIDLLDKRRPLEKLTDEELAKRAAEADALLRAEGGGE
jgi:hypothetical protein